MHTDYISETRTRERPRRGRAVAVSLLGPLTAAAGLLWALAQPYRVTFLHPQGQGFWFLVVEPPVLVILVGVLFQFLLVPSLVKDLEEADE